MRTTLISTLLFAGILFVSTQAFAGPGGSPGPSEMVKDQNASKARGVTVSGHVIPAPKGPPEKRFAPDSVLVRFKPGTPSDNKAMGRQMVKGKKVHAYSIVPGLEHLRIGIPGLEVEEAIRILERLPFVEYAEPNYIISINQTIPDDVNFSEQWALHNTGQSSQWDMWGPGTPGADIDAPEAWDIITASNSLVAIIDTGITYDHPDLANNVWTNPGEIDGLVDCDDDGNGYVDDIYGWDFAYDDNNPYDGHGHGSHVAGIVAAEGNNGVSVTPLPLPPFFYWPPMGTSGILWQGQLMALKALDDNGSGWVTDAVEALEYAVMMGARISNNSWGYYDEGELGHQALYDAIAAAQADDHLFMAAAGNGDELGFGLDTDTAPHYPSSLPLDNIISVAATDYNDNLASFSNYGLQSVDLAAPGVWIFSTWKWTLNPLTGETLPDYAWLDGTSMATPHVVGVAAMVSEIYPDWTYAQIRDRILATVRPLNALNGITVTGGILNAANAVTASGSPPTADFSYTTDNLTVTFTDLSDDDDGTVESWDWDFGDGQVSNLQNPENTYAGSGTYTVTLTVTDDDGAPGTISQDVIVTESLNIPPVASFTYACIGLECTFDGTGSTDSDGFIESYQWDFGDGYSSYLVDPYRLYNSANTYTVTLTVTDNLSSTNMTSQDVTVNENASINLTAGANGSSVTLEWVYTSGNAEGFAIERATKIRGKYDFGAPSSVSYVTGPEATSYIDTGVDPGTYKYRIRASFAGDTFSDWSNEVLVKVEAAICGDLICDPGEDLCSCPEDCSTPPPPETNCSDSLDNDCDGFIDCVDTDCSEDPICISPPVCLPKGALCTSNSECCSGDCRGIKCK